MSSDDRFARRPSSRDPSDQRYRCVECRRLFPASEVYDDGGEVICEECFGDTEERFDESVDEETGIEVRANTFVLSLLTLLATPQVVIDGREYSLSWWSTRFFPPAPGPHTIRVYVNHLFGAIGDQRVKIRLRANRTRMLNYSYYVWWLPSQLNVR